jgi:hypothetical protein
MNDITLSMSEPRIDEIIFSVDESEFNNNHVFNGGSNKGRYKLGYAGGYGSSSDSSPSLRGIGSDSVSSDSDDEFVTDQYGGLARKSQYGGRRRWRREKKRYELNNYDEDNYDFSDLPVSPYSQKGGCGCEKQSGGNSGGSGKTSTEELEDQMKNLFNQAASQLQRGGGHYNPGYSDDSEDLEVMEGGMGGMGVMEGGRGELFKAITIVAKDLGIGQGMKPGKEMAKAKAPIFDAYKKAKAELGDKVKGMSVSELVSTLKKYMKK